MFCRNRMTFCYLNNSFTYYKIMENTVELYRVAVYTLSL